MAPEKFRDFRETGPWCCDGEYASVNELAPAAKAIK